MPSFNKIFWKRLIKTIAFALVMMVCWWEIQPAVGSDVDLGGGTFVRISYFEFLCTQNAGIRKKEAVIISRTNDRPLRSAPHNLPEGDGLGWRSQNFGGRVKIVCMRCIHPSFHPYVVHPVIDLADDDDRIDRHKS